MSELAKIFSLIAKGVVAAKNAISVIMRATDDKEIKDLLSEIKGFLKKESKESTEELRNEIKIFESTLLDINRNDEDDKLIDYKKEAKVKLYKTTNEFIKNFQQKVGASNISESAKEALNNSLTSFQKSNPQITNEKPERNAFLKFIDKTVNKDNRVTKFFNKVYDKVVVPGLKIVTSKTFARGVMIGGAVIALVAASVAGAGIPLAAAALGLTVGAVVAGTVMQVNQMRNQKSLLDEKLLLEKRDLYEEKSKALAKQLGVNVDIVQKTSEIYPEEEIKKPSKIRSAAKSLRDNIGEEGVSLFSTAITGNIPGIIASSIGFVVGRAVDSNKRIDEDAKKFLLKNEIQKTNTERGGKDYKDLFELKILERKQKAAYLALEDLAKDAKLTTLTPEEKTAKYKELFDKHSTVLEPKKLGFFQKVKQGFKDLGMALNPFTNNLYSLKNKKSEKFQKKMEDRSNNLNNENKQQVQSKGNKVDTSYDVSNATLLTPDSNIAIGHQRARNNNHLSNP